MMNFIRAIDPCFARIMIPLQPIFLLFSRLWVALIFFRSGWIKYTSWDSTLFLFEYEYKVPLIPWQTAAYLGTSIELIVPIFLVLGLFTRPLALLLFCFNVVTVLSYPVLWQQGFSDHQLWGLMMLINVFFGAGYLSADHLLNKSRQSTS